jgi:hypothetical protein
LIGMERIEKNGIIFIKVTCNVLNRNFIRSSNEDKRKKD